MSDAVTEQPVAPKEVVDGVKPVEPAQDEISKKEEQKANLDKAIAEANETLRQKREEIKKTSAPANDEIPKIDDEDPSAKAWNNRIKETVAPVSSQLEKQKEEVRTFALRKFLADKPALARNKEKLTELMSNYDRIKVATEQTQEGVLLDLDKAYAVTFHEELVSAARNARLDQAKEDMIASDIAISKSADAEPAKAPVKRQLSREEQEIIKQWETFGAPKVD